MRISVLFESNLLKTYNMTVTDLGPKLLPNYSENCIKMKQNYTERRTEGLNNKIVKSYGIGAPHWEFLDPPLGGLK